MNKAATTMRAGLKEPAKVKAMAQESFKFNSSLWTEGEQGAKSAVDSLKVAGKST